MGLAGKYGFSISNRKCYAMIFFSVKKHLEAHRGLGFGHTFCFSKWLKICLKMSHSFIREIETFLKDFPPLCAYLLIATMAEQRNRTKRFFEVWKLKLCLKVSHVAFEAFANRFQFGSVLRSAKVVRDMQAGFFKEFFPTIFFSGKSQVCLQVSNI